MVERRRAWALTLALWLGFVFVVAYEIAPASFLPLVEAGLGVGPTAASWLVSIFLLAMAGFSIPAGLLLDRVDNRRAIFLSALAVLLTSVWAWRAGAAVAYPRLLAARFVGGMATVTLWTAAVNVVDGAFDRESQGTAIAVFATSIPAGFVVSHLTAPLLASRVGWAGTFPVYGLLGALAIGGFAIASRGVDISVDVETPTRREFGAVLRNPHVWAVAGMAFAAFSLNLLFNRAVARSPLPQGATQRAKRVSSAVGRGGARHAHTNH